MANNTIATAYVQIQPSMQGVKGTLEKEFGAEGQAAGSAFSGGITSALSGIAPVAIGAAGAAAAAVGSVAAVTADLGKQAIEAYGDFEQLQGGVETLFGADAHKVMTNANMAFKTAGQSANQYMEMTIQSAASMISSLEGDTAKAAELMDLAIVDMSDNVNKMGTTMESVQNAYRGFSRGNFTMLDNLALGYAGTKQGMQELLEKAKEISGIEYNIESYSDIVQAIHVVQEQMDIAGTTQKEAADTIQGSLASMKSAWDNLITSIANDDMDTRTIASNFVDSLVTVFDNVLPAAHKAMDGLSAMVDSLIPALTEKVLPQLTAEIPGFVTQFIGVISNVFSASPELLTAGMQIIVAILQGITDAMPALSATAPVLIQGLIQAFFDNAPALTEAFYTLMEAAGQGFIDAFPQLMAMAPQFIEQYISLILSVGLPRFFECAAELLGAMILSIMEHLPELLEAGLEIIAAIIGGIDDGIPNVLVAMMHLHDSVEERMKQLMLQMSIWAGDMIINFVKGLMAKFPLVDKAVTSLANLVKKYLHFSEPDVGPLADFSTYAPDMMKLFAQGIKDNEDVVTAQIQSSFDFGNQIKEQNANVIDTAMSSPAYAPTESVVAVDTQNNEALSGQFAQAVELLGQLVDKDPVEIGADATGIFNLVRRENSIYKRANGMGALA